MRISKLVVLCILVFFLSGCAFSPPPPPKVHGDYRPVNQIPQVDDSGKDAL